MTPLHKEALQHALKMLSKFIEEAPLEKSCTLCMYYKGKTCRMFDSKPPEHIVKIGCDSFEFDPESAPF